MNQLICASLFHTHYRYEVGMLKVPAVNARSMLQRVAIIISGRNPRSVRVVATDSTLIQTLFNTVAIKGVRVQLVAIISFIHTAVVVLGRTSIYT